jgi:hypothetical protein
MATYYVRNDGNDANTGLGYTTTLAWKTLTKALGSTGISSGDTLYIAPGRYYEFVTIGFNSPTVETKILGDPLCTQFLDITPGLIRWTAYINDTSGPTASILLTLPSKNFLTIKNIRFESQSQSCINISTSINITIDKCTFLGGSGSQYLVTYSNPSNTAANLLITNNILIRNSVNSVHISNLYIVLNGTIDYDANVIVANNIILGGGTSQYDNRNAVVVVAGYTQGYCYFVNNTLGLAAFGGITTGTSSSSFPIRSYDNNELFSSISPRQFSFFSEKLVGLTPVDPFGPFSGSSLISAGLARSSSVTITASNAQIPSGGNTYNVGDRIQFSFNLGNISTSTIYVVSTVTGSTSFTCTGLIPSVSGNNNHRRFRLDTDIFNAAHTPDNISTLGAVNLKSQSNIGLYIPADKRDITYNVSSDTTSRSELIYLGSVGLNYQTSSLSIKYIRVGSNAITINLASQTPNGSWVSGGFCEIDAVNLPGMYRLDVPNEVFASGVKISTLIIKGVNILNGYYINYNLQPLALDMAQPVPTSNTAQTVGDALNAARAQGFGKWAINGTTLSLYAPDNTTVVKSFTLDSAKFPSQRV